MSQLGIPPTALYLDEKTTRTLHDVKSHPRPFQDVWDGNKRAEVRVNDRDYGQGDALLIREYDPGPRPWDRHSAFYTGREIVAIITHVQQGYGLPPDLVVLSIDVVDRQERPVLSGVKEERKIF
ncbi:RNA-binding protein [Burkholderia phage BcepSaruman]|uniref:DUF3850 domain-containing protein n=1 Tax=Burkholderia phage BcepSaruman TaxID=2530032 RepID=A0A4D5ZGV0_9CAUD|nr:RNA-binding protein [Burkholderia phage BcepSaruman]QBX06732.1 hypothetical protein BcepSaruman_319 [Burkholderia phage BcepSaruman]